MHKLSSCDLVPTLLTTGRAGPPGVCVSLPLPAGPDQLGDMPLSTGQNVKGGVQSQEQLPDRAAEAPYIPAVAS